MIRLAIITATAVAAGLVAATVPAAAGTVWSTCHVQATLRTGVYRVDNDEFTGPAYTPQPSCITSADGHDLTIVTSYRPGPGVVAAPSIRVGPWYASRDPGAVFPVMAGAAGGIVLRERAAGLDAPGLWLLDTAVWLYPHSNIDVRGRPATEIEIGMAPASRSQPGAGWQFAKIAGTRFWVHHGWTGTPGVAGSWPLTVLRPVREHHALTIPLGVYLRDLHRLGMVRLRNLVGSVQMHAECWSGCGGLSYSLVVTGPAAYVPPPAG